MNYVNARNRSMFGSGTSPLSGTQFLICFSFTRRHFVVYRHIQFRQPG